MTRRRYTTLYQWIYGHLTKSTEGARRIPFTTALSISTISQAALYTTIALLPLVTSFFFFQKCSAPLVSTFKPYPVNRVLSLRHNNVRPAAIKIVINQTSRIELRNGL